MVGAIAPLPLGGPQRDGPRHLAEPERGLCDDARRDPLLARHGPVPLHGGSRARPADSMGIPDARRMNTTPHTSMTDDRTKQWYIVHTYSGFENKVKESLEQRVNAYGLQAEIGEILIPTEMMTAMRGGETVVYTKCI